MQALFDVIGTPAWADVDKVEIPAWRNYLAGMPGTAPTLYRRFVAPPFFLPSVAQDSLLLLLHCPGLAAGGAPPAAAPSEILPQRALL